MAAILLQGPAHRECHPAPDDLRWAARTRELRDLVLFLLAPPILAQLEHWREHIRQLQQIGRSLTKGLARGLPHLTDFHHRPREGDIANDANGDQQASLPPIKLKVLPRSPDLFQL